ncbi:hypothetical protein PILCRDRAFT_150990 [Piloderma croceum F 1598]|uniref:Transmembrane protein n=1 Tax=Piloderma croceum (strain F 1598) TaxID=765440 RepID=A0A0C3CME9_PILCF|nr:hypothetical protein PILCRDRAFT_150990 [Piloderma croceum F 1598]
MPVSGAIETLQEPSVNEFLAHPDFRQVAAFFLGWVFMASLICMLYSSVFQNLLNRCVSGLFTTSGGNASDSENSPEKSPSIWTGPSVRGSSLFTKRDNHTLVFALCICLAFASVGYFLSLLSFDPRNGPAACAFVVAWGGMAAQSARLVGLLILSFELRKLGIGRWETTVFRIGLGIGIVFVFVTNAISTGTTEVVQQIAVSLCYRRHFLPTSLVSSLIYFCFELYVVIRLALLIAPAFMQLKHRLGAMTDVRVLQGISLMLLELLTVVPAVTFTGVLGEFIPFSVGSLAVLATFNYCNSVAVKSQLTSIPTIIHSSSPSRRSAAPTIHSLFLSDEDPPRPPSPYHYPQSIPNHPFSHWPRRPESARRSENIDSVVANSIRDAVIQVASTGSRAPVNRLPQGVSPLPSSTENPPSSTSASDPIPGQPLRPRHILPDQATYAERFEHKEQAAPPINTNYHALRSWPIAESVTARSPRSLISVVCGSDVIKVDRQSSATSTTRQSSRSGAAASGLRHSYLASSPYNTSVSLPSRSSRRYSWTATNEELVTLPVLYETSIERTPETEVPSKPRPLTFGEQAFHDAPLFYANTGLPSVPVTGPSGPKMRGPRPPLPLGADGRSLTLSLDEALYLHRPPT